MYFGQLLEAGGTWAWRRCLGPGTYRLEIQDSWGDGTCCEWGNGYYSVSVDGVEVGAADGAYGRALTLLYRFIST